MCVYGYACLSLLSFHTNTPPSSCIPPLTSHPLPLILPPHAHTHTPIHALTVHTPPSLYTLTVTTVQPDLLKLLLIPVLAYAHNDTFIKFSNPFSPHQLGTYPIANDTTARQVRKEGYINLY